MSAVAVERVKAATALSAVIVIVISALLLWFYLSAHILLLDAEFTAEHSRWRRAGCPVETRSLREWIASTPKSGREEEE
jgi:uncharacterized BrkB/YihY/UPF0761 family membrane protein